MTDYLFDKRGEDAEVAKLEELLGDYAHDAPLAPVRSRDARVAPAGGGWRRWLRVALPVTAGLAAAAVIAIVVIGRGGGGGDDPGGRAPIAAAPADAAGPPSPACDGAAPGFAFSVSQGDARCGGARAAAGTLPVGGWLEVDDGGLAEVRIADIGELVVFGGSQVRLVGTGPAEHRIELARGRLSASVDAPPRLFVVDTPVAAAVDLGCVYELEVDDDGRTHLRVTKGEVSLEGKAGVVAYVPAGTEVVAMRAGGPGTPLALDASLALRAAVQRFDAGDAGAVAALVEAAGPYDAITLWNALARVAPAGRAALMHALAARSPRPAHVGEDAVLAGDRAALEAWRADVADRWFDPPQAPRKEPAP